MSKYNIEAGTGQHIGDRSEQQDRVTLLVAPKAPGFMMAVIADGMGGKSGGSIAAEQVIRTSNQLFNEFGAKDDVVKLLEEIAKEAHIIIQLSGISSDKEPHSTLVILIITPNNRAVWAHVGDSRLYRFSGPNCRERTRDHSYVEKLIAEKKIEPNEANNHKHSNVLVNVLGSSKKLPYVTINECNDLQANDAFLLCTDGLWKYFNDQELGAVISVNTPRIAAEKLVAKARERGEPHGDNCTLAIVKLVQAKKVELAYKIEKM